MATAIPSSMSWEMLSRLPSNSFIIEYQEIRPDQQPTNSVYQIAGQGAQSQKLRFHIRGAPNEFLLNTNVFVAGSAYVDMETISPLDKFTFQKLCNDPDFFLNSPFHWFKSSRESFNSGALPYLDNQDSSRSHIINQLRYSLARRGRSDKLLGMKDLGRGFDSRSQALSLSVLGDADENARQFLGSGIRMKASWLEDVPYVGAVAGQYAYLGGNKSFQIPLGLYSNLVNSHSVVPIGLMSSYAVNGWSIELDTEAQGGFADGKVMKCGGDIGIRFGLAILVPLAPKVYLKDVRIVVPVIKILDPSVMEAVLSLYEKREMVNVGGVQFPLSLRMNSMAYRFASFPLTSGTQDYFFRVAGTDRSVRAVAWWVHRPASSTNGTWNVSDVVASPTLTRLETTIGNEHPHSVVEDIDPTSSNISNFLQTNIKHSGALFSPLPYYQECRKMDGQQDDDLDGFNNGLVNVLANTNGTNVVARVQIARNSIAYGVISLENLDRREADYSGSFSASGKDLTNVGGVDIRMRWQQTVITALALSDLHRFGPIQDNYEICFVYAYDSVMEISPQGVMDVTNAVL